MVELLEDIQGEKVKGGLRGSPNNLVNFHFNIFTKFTRVNFWLLLLVLTSPFDAILKLMESKVIWNRTYREGKGNFNL